MQGQTSSSPSKQDEVARDRLDRRASRPAIWEDSAVATTIAQRISKCVIEERAERIDRDRIVEHVRLLDLRLIDAGAHPKDMASDSVLHFLSTVEIVDEESHRRSRNFASAS